MEDQIDFIVNQTYSSLRLLKDGGQTTEEKKKSNYIDPPSNQGSMDVQTKKEASPIITSSSKDGGEGPGTDNWGGMGGWGGGVGGAGHV